MRSISKLDIYQWHFLPEINVYDEDFSGVSGVEFVKIIDHILLFHRGLVEKFNVDIDKVEKLNHTDVDRWILYVSRNGIKELAICNCNEYYDIPSCIFSCSDLTCLFLCKCMVKPPASFKGFVNLTKLTFIEVIIDSKVLENVINSCPLLSELKLMDVVEPSSSLKIDAPKLVMLCIHGFVYIPRLIINTPLLDSAYFLLDFWVASSNGDCMIVQLLGSMPILRRLNFEGFALEYLAVGDVPVCLPSVCPIKHLKLPINFESLQELQLAFCIFRSSPILQHLVISSRSGLVPIYPDGFWKGQHDFSFRFDHLQTVELDLTPGSKSELKFIEFLLSKAPALKSIDIRSSYIPKDAPRVVKEITGFPRISPNARLTLPSLWNM